MPTFPNSGPNIPLMLTGLSVETCDIIRITGVWLVGADDQKCVGQLMQHN